MNIEKYIDNTILKANATWDEVEEKCKEALEYNFAAVCINPSYVKKVKEFLRDSNVKVCTVIGFPLGANHTNVKVYETKQAIIDGADEIDMVINIGYLLDNKFDEVENEIRAIKEVCKDKALLKVIIETSELNDELKRIVANMVISCKADYIKTSTGFSSSGANEKDVRLLASIVKDHAKVKASGGIRDYESAIKMVEAGASRLGVSSGKKIMEGCNIND